MKSEDDIAMLAGETEDDAIKAAYETSKEDEKFKNLFKGLFLIKLYFWQKVKAVRETSKRIQFIYNLQAINDRTLGLVKNRSIVYG